MSKSYFLIAGSRGYEHLDEFMAIVDENIHADTLLYEVVIVEGGARGVDTMARIYAKARGLAHIEMKPDWEKYGRAAGPKRNDEMTAFVADQCRGNNNKGTALFFWDGESKGTKHCIESAKKRGIPTRIWNTKTGKYMEGEEKNEHNHNDPD